MVAFLLCTVRDAKPEITLISFLISCNYLLLLLLLLYIELTISFLIGRKRIVNFQNQRLGCHLAADCR